MNDFALRLAGFLVAYTVLPFLVNGVIVRTKARWAGRRGPPLFQLFNDVVRLLRKDAVRSATATAVFPIGAWTALGTSLAAALLVPTIVPRGVVSFPFDFVALAYVYGLGRVALVLTALDTGSSFEGMGASREVTFSAVAEPALFLALASLCALTDDRSFGGLLAVAHHGTLGPVFVIACGVALFIVLQVETSRLPVDDPNTHLELTMIHEVMVLDHSGPELAAVQLGTAYKMTTLLLAIAALLNPFDGGWRYVAATGALVIFVAMMVAFMESAIARFRMSAVPKYATVAVLAGLISLVAANVGVRP